MYYFFKVIKSFSDIVAELKGVACITYFDTFRFGSVRDVGELTSKLSGSSYSGTFRVLNENSTNT